MPRSTSSMLHACLAICALGFAGASPAQSQMSPSAAIAAEGDWRVADGSAVIRFERCGGELCGRIIQMRDGPGALDEANPIRVLRSRPVCGITIVSKLRPGVDGRWTGGRLYDPESGYTLNDVSIQPRADTLRVSIGSGPFAGSETWHRASAPARSCGGV